MHMPKTLIRSFAITLRTEEGTTEKLTIERNIKRYVSIPIIGKNIREITLTPLTTWGEEECRVVSFEVR